MELAFKGGLQIKSEAHRFELALPEVKFDSGAAEITADVTANGATKDDVPLATVTVAALGAAAGVAVVTGTSFVLAMRGRRTMIE